MRRRDALKTSGIFAAACAGLFLVLTGSSGASPVSAPTSLAASAVSSSQINLTWVDTNSNETGYLVERSLSSSSGFVQIASLAANTQSYSNTGLAAATTYYYQVRATHSGAFSPYSNVASARTLSSAPTATPPPPTPTRTPTPGGPTPTRTPTPSGSIPAAPSNLTAAAISSSQISLAWTDNSNNETAFRVERAPASAGPWTYIGATTLTGYGDSGLAASTTYFYRVAAYNTAGTSAYTNTASAATQAASGVPSAPSSLLASAVSSSQVNLTWVDTSSNETGFKIERSTSTVPWAQIGTTGTNVTSYSSTGLSASTAYSYRVRATNATGDSLYSNTASATTSAIVGGSGAFLWSTHFGGTTLAVDTATPVGMVVDSSGASVVVGYLSGKADFGGGLLTSAGAGDIYLVKRASDGSYIWSKRFGGTADDRPKGIAIDASGNIVITGYFNGTVDFGGGALTSATSAASGFVAKYSATGAHMWSKRLSTGGSSDAGYAIAVDGSGNVIVGATLTGTSDYGGGPLTTRGGFDIVLVKYSATGGYIWAKQIGGANNESVTSLAVDQTTGEIVAVGNFDGSTDFGAGTVTTAGGLDVFVAKYSSAGAWVWSKHWGSTGADQAGSVAIDRLGNVVVTGAFTFNVDFGGGPITNAGDSSSADIFLVKLSPAGLHLWSKGFGNSISAGQAGNGVAFDGAGNVLLTGSIVALTAPYTIDFGGGPITGDGYYNVFLAKFGSDGSYVWAKRYLGGGGNAHGQAIASDNGDNVLATGDFQVSENFGGTTMTCSGASDTYLVKLGP